MLFRQPFLDGIRQGTITVAFRRWRRPTVRAGGTLLTSVGQLTIASVSRLALTQISEADARRAGYESLEALLAELRSRNDGDVYRVELGPVRPDPRVALRESEAFTDVEYRELRERLVQLDTRSIHGPWTQSVLELIRSHPGVRAGDLCGLVGQDIKHFKLNVRKLKSLGLTESLEVGYRLSPRGMAFVRTVQSKNQTVR